MARDARTAIALVATAQILVLAAIVLQLNPNTPPWLARLIPTYWFGAPLHDVIVNGASFGDVRTDLAAALALAAATAVVIVFLGRRMEARLATE